MVQDTADCQQKKTIQAGGKARGSVNRSRGQLYLGSLKKSLSFVQ